MVWTCFVKTMLNSSKIKHGERNVSQHTRVGWLINNGTFSTTIGRSCYGILTGVCSLGAGRNNNTNNTTLFNLIFVVP